MIILYLVFIHSSDLQLSKSAYSEVMQTSLKKHAPNCALILPLIFLHEIYKKSPPMHLSSILNLAADQAVNILISALNLGIITWSQWRWTLYGVHSWFPFREQLLNIYDYDGFNKSLGLKQITIWTLQLLKHLQTETLTIQQLYWLWGREHNMIWLLSATGNSPRSPKSLSALFFSINKPSSQKG